MKPIISARGLTKRYGRTVAVDHVDLDISAGKIVGLIGPNGAGKTTVMKAILGLTTFDGELDVLGLNPAKQRAALMEEVCFIADVAVLPRWIRVWQLVELTGQLHPKFSKEICLNYLAKTKINQQQKVTFLPFNDLEAFQKEIEKGDVCGVILEAIQGVGGLDQPSTDFYQNVATLCKSNKVILIADEVQSGFGRSGKFFGFQHHDITPDIISIAKGMGNGFPVGGVLIHQAIKASYGLLGTTFGGNHLACAATMAVLEVLENEELLKNATKLETYFKSKAKEIPQIKRVKGRGLMLGLEFDFEVADLRKRLIHNQHLFTGGAKDKYVLRVLPALNITEVHLDIFFEALIKELS